MSLTSGQKATLKAAILADSNLNNLPNNSDGNSAIAALLAVAASPDFWVWRTNVGQAEIVTATSLDATNWSWTVFINRSQGERDAWREMFADTGRINFALTNVIQAVNDIFSGAAPASTQRTHIFTIGRRKATKAEKLFATGTGSTASPAIMGFEGTLSYQDVQEARDS